MMLNNAKVIGVVIVAVSLLVWQSLRWRAEVLPGPARAAVSNSGRPAQGVELLVAEPDHKPRTFLEGDAPGATESTLASPVLVLRLRNALTSEPIRGRVVFAGRQLRADDTGSLKVDDEAGREHVDVAAPNFMPTRLWSEELRAEWRSRREPVAHLWPIGRLVVHVRDDRGIGISGVSLRVSLSSDNPAHAGVRSHIPVFSNPGDREHLESMRAHAARGHAWKEVEGTEIVDALTDSHGTYRMPPLPAGISLEVEASGPVQPVLGRIVLDASATDTELVLTATAGHFVRGRVLRDGLPAGQVHLQLQAYDRMQRLSAITEPIQGEFSFAGVPEGRIRLHAELPGAVPLDLDLTAPGIDVGTLHFTQGVRCTGRLTSSRPLGDRQLFQIAATQFSSSVRTQLVEADGSFRISLEPGEAQLAIRNGDLPKSASSLAIISVQAPFEDLEIDMDAYMGAVEVEVPPELSPDSRTLTLDWCGQSSLRATEVPLRVQTEPTEGGAGEMIWDRLAPGMYQVLARDGERVLAAEVVVEAGSTTQARLSAAASTLVGSVSGLAESGATVRATSKANHQWSASIVEGRYSLSGLLPVVVDVNVLDSMGALLASQSVRLAPGENTANLSVDPLASVTVRLPHGTPSEGAEVRLHRGDVDWMDTLAPLRSAPFDETGEVTFVDLLPGVYVALAVGKDEPLRRVRFELLPGVNTTVRLEDFRATIKVSFTVGGAPVTDVSRLVAVLRTKDGAVSVTRGPSVDGWFELPRVHGRTVFLLQRRSHPIGMSTSTAFPPPPVTVAVCDFDAGDTRKVVAIAGHGLTLHGWRGAAHVERPTAWLVDVEGSDFSRYMPHQLLAPTDSPSGALRWNQLPTGSRVRVLGVDSRGRPVSETIRVDTDAALEWPH